MSAHKVTSMIISVISQLVNAVLSVVNTIVNLPALRPARDLAIDFMTNHRGWFVIFFVLPFSLLFDIFFAVRARLIMLFFSAPKLHEERVKDVVEQIKQWRKSGSGTRLCTARGGWQSISPGYRSYKMHSTQIRVDMYDILEYIENDPRAGGEATVRVEPLVNMGQISHFLIARGKVALFRLMLSYILKLTLTTNTRWLAIYEIGNIYGRTNRYTSTP